MSDSPPSAPPARWTPERQCLFLHWLDRTRCASISAAKAGLSRESAYRLRARNPEGLFALVWHDIMHRPRRYRAGHRVEPSR
jgi:hypothetical protein